MSCQHGHSYWATEEWEDDYGNIHYDHRQEHVSYYEDLDLHRYHCTACKEIFYYSQAARDYHEQGIKADIIGLDS